MPGAESILFRQFQRQVWGEDDTWRWRCPKDNMCSAQAQANCPITKLVQEASCYDTDWDVFLRARHHLEQHHLDPRQKRIDGRTPDTQANTVLICADSHTALHSTDQSASRLPRTDSVLSAFLDFMSINIRRGNIWKQSKIQFSLSHIANSLNTTKGWISEIIRGKIVDGETKYGTKCLQLENGLVHFTGKQCNSCYFNRNCRIQNNPNI